jgi:uncharacterized protein involved in exopolysaccharide biosynthesis
VDGRTMDDEINLKDTFNLLWKRRLLISAIFIIFVLVAAVISFVIPQIYETSGIVALGNFGEPIYTSQAAAKAIMLSDEFLLDLFEELNISMTPSKFAEFKSHIKIEPVKDTDGLIQISIQSSDKHQGIEIVEGMVRLFANRSQEPYNRQMQILSDQLAVTKEDMNVVETDINQTRESLNGIEKVAGASSESDELRISRTLDHLQGEETRFSTLQDRYQDLKKQLTLLRHLDVVQKPTEPISPIWPKKALIVALAGMLGLMVGIFAAFLREGLRKRTE